MNVQIFKNDQFGEIRIVLNENGEPLFCLSDVAKSLGYNRPADAVTQHCKGVVVLPTPTKNQHGATVMQDIKFGKEGEMYRLIMKSKLPGAEKFQDWVCYEVLPSIRKHGAYATESTIEKILNDPEFGIQLLTKLKDEQTKRLKAETKVTILTHTNKTYTCTEIAKELGFKSAKELNKKLHDLGVQYKQNDTWVPYSKYSNRAWFDIKQEVLDSGKIIYHRRITGIGRDGIIDLLTA